MFHTYLDRAYIDHQIKLCLAGQDNRTSCVSFISGFRICLPLFPLGLIKRWGKTVICGNCSGALANENIVQNNFKIALLNLF